MADVRTLKLNLLADVDQFNRGMAQAKNDTSGFGATISKVSKRATLAFEAMAVSAAYAAVRIGKDAVKAAIEDQKSARILETQLKKTVNANDDLVASVEDYIGKTQLRVGVQDDKLRPSFARLLRSTEDVAEAQKLMNLALDISVATGKEVDSVASALGKTWDGSATSLAKLGVGIDSSVLKSGDLNAIYDALRKNFDGFANDEARSVDGQLRVLNIGVDELKESIGYALLPQLNKMVEYANGFVLPVLTDMADGFAGTGKAAESASYRFGQSLNRYKVAIEELFAVFTGKGAGAFRAYLEYLTTLINRFSTVIETLRKVIEAAKKNLGLNFGNDTGQRNPIKPSIRIRAAGGSVMGGQAYRVGEFGPETFVPSGSGSIRKASATGNVTININGIVDAESARRSIEKLLQDSARRTGAVSLIGATL